MAFLATKSSEFLQSIAQELNMDSETSPANILEAYLKNVGNINILRKQIERRGGVNRVLIVGQTGAGKSSLVNLLAAKKVANVSDSARGCTFQFETYQAVYNGELYELIDTVGLNESSKGSVNARDAMKMLIKFINGNKRGFSCVLFVMSKGRITDSFEKNHMLFCKTLLNGETPAILFLSHCESDEPMDRWIKNAENKDALNPFSFNSVVCGTAQDGGRLSELIKPLRDETYEHLWRSISEHMLEAPRPIKPSLHLFKRVWNTFCDWFGLSWKFVTNQYDSFLQYLKSLGVDDKTIEQTKRDLH